MSKFTLKDAGNLIALARRAPLNSMDEAEAAADLLQRFGVFCQEVLDSDNQLELDVDTSAGGTD